MKFLDFLHENIVFLDGGMGTLLQEKGLLPGEKPEEWNLSHPEIITEIHKAYLDAGSNVICTNTFGANLLKFSEGSLISLIQKAVENAKRACEASSFKEENFIALDVGPLGRLLKPFGDLDFEDAVEIFKKTIQIGAESGVDLIFIETMNDSYETKAALLAAKEITDLPVLVSNAYGEDSKLMTGASPAAMVAMLEGMGADAIGANCSLGPRQLKKVAEELLKYASVPVILKPNAGLPKTVDGKTVFDIEKEDFAEEVFSLMEKGISVVGGCCGTTPEYISALKAKTKHLRKKPIEEKLLTMVSSYTDAVVFDRDPILIGERINPTGKKRLRTALIERDYTYLFNEGLRQQEKKAHILDVNVGIPDIEEKEVLKETVEGLQAILDLPLQIDTASPEAMEIALRIYNGKAMINSVNGKKESMDSIFPLAKKYGGLVTALLLDENGIPETCEGRIEIAKKILKVAEEYGISKKDLIFDPLAMTVSADPNAADTTLKALRILRDEMGCHTLLGVSNVSFGLPNRDAITSAFFALALENGLSGAIMNPDSPEMMRTYYAYRALKGLDDHFLDYIENADKFSVKMQEKASEEKQEDATSSELFRAIQKGLSEEAKKITKRLVCHQDGLEIVNSEIIPALNEVGRGFEEKRIYLPQLLMSAEAAKGAFEVIKASFGETGNTKKRFPVVLATVKGDIHDIGKNILKLLFENYGFDVIDLGKDVPCEKILKEVISSKAPLCCLSALMTTTVPAMEETLCKIRKEAPFCRCVVGGAVLNQEFADRIGADFYAKDAMAAVRFAERIEKEPENIKTNS